MDPAEFIIRLQAQNARSLEVYPDSVIRRITVPNQLFIIVREATHHDVGYLLHSRVRRYAATQLWTICVAKGCRRRGHGRRLLELLVDRIATAGGTGLITTCPAHLAADPFFPHLGFRLTTRKRPNPAFQTKVNHYFLPIEPKPTPQNRPRSRRSRWIGYPRTTTLDALRRFSGVPPEAKSPD